MNGVEPSLNWNNGKPGKAPLTVTTGTVVSTDDTVCMTETSKSGTTFEIADIGAGTNAGTYFGTNVACATDVPTLTGGGGWNQSGW